MSRFLLSLAYLTKLFWTVPGWLSCALFCYATSCCCFGKFATASDVDILRQLTFCSGSLDLVADGFVRRVGRPRNEWAPCPYKEVLKLVGGSASLRTAIQRLVEVTCALLSNVWGALEAHASSTKDMWKSSMG